MREDIDIRRFKREMNDEPIDVSALQAAWLTKLVWDKSQQITALESQLAAAIDALRPFAEDYTEMLPEADMLTHVIERYEKAHEIVTAYDARQSTEVPPPVPPERADAVSLVQQQYQLERAVLASRHEHEREETEDWYRRAMNEALNSDENGV